VGTPIARPPHHKGGPGNFPGVPYTPSFPRGAARAATRAGRQTGLNLLPLLVALAVLCACGCGSIRRANRLTLEARVRPIAREEARAEVDAQLAGWLRAVIPYAVGAGGLTLAGGAVVRRKVKGPS
jgi:hypothetical protein